MCGCAQRCHWSAILTPKEPRKFFQKDTPNMSFLVQKAQMNFFNFYTISIIVSYPRLLGKHVQKVLQKLTLWIVRLSMFEVERKIFFPCAQ